MFSQETIRLSPSLKRVLIIQKSKWYNYHRAQTIMLIIWFLKWENLKFQSFELRFISTSINLLTAVSKSFLQVVKVTDHKLGNPPKSHKNPPWASLFCIKFFKPGIQDSSAEETLFLKYKNKWCIGFKIYIWWSSDITEAIMIFSMKQIYVFILWKCNSIVLIWWRFGIQGTDIMWNFSRDLERGDEI